MSKELAQTVGGKRTAWLIAILAAFAVFATVATQWRGADAIVPSTTITVTDGSSAGAGDTWTYTATFAFSGTEAATPNAVFYFPHDSELQFVDATGDIGAIEGDECAYWTSTSVRCLDNDADATNYTNGALSLNFMVPYEGAYVSAPTFSNSNCYLDDGGAGTAYCTASNLATFQADNAVQVDPEYGTNAVGVAHTVTFTLPAGMSCGSDDYNNDGDLDGQVDCVESDVSTDADILDVTVRDADTSDESYVDVTVVAGETGTYYIQLYVTSDSENDGGGTTFYSEQASKEYVLAELRHIDDDPDWSGSDSDVDVIADQDVNNNVVGSTHVVCTIVANSDGQGSSEIWTDDSEPIYVPFQAGDITFSTGGGYLSTADDEPTVDDLQVFEGDGTSPYEPNGYEGNGGLEDASCFSWISTGAGDQQITVTYEGDDGQTYTVRWDTDGNVASVNSRALIKEWNQLEDSQVTLSGGATGTGSGNSTTTPVITRTIQGIFNPATSRYDFDDVYIDDIMRGSHTTRTGQALSKLSLHGVNWHIAGHEGCGDIYWDNTYTFDYLYDSLDDSGSDNVLEFYGDDAYYLLYIGQIIRGENADGDGEYMQVTDLYWNGYSTEVTVVRNVRSPYHPTQPAPGLAEFDEGDYFAFIQTTQVDSDPEGGYDVVNTPNVGFWHGEGIEDEVCGPGAWAEVTIVGGEPGPQGSSDGDTVTQIIRFEFTAAPPPTKAVFLAWAGQRVLLEYDWRLPAGDDPTDDRNEYDANGYCPFGYYNDLNGSTDTQPSEGFWVAYTRGSGPGNFVPGLYAYAADNGGWRNGAHVWVYSDEDQSWDAPQYPQDACISRVIYESEDEGQVDIEAFVENDYRCYDIPAQCSSDNQTKIAFVIYYMKIEKVATSLVTGNEDGAALVKKPKHNATDSDFAPGNPWRYDNDLTAAESNVSTDVLVRVRVKGWFLTSNPSGRERDASDPNNVLPQDRWVMPDDWARLIAGGAGIDFRPEYDYMFAPNNTKGVTLDIPCGCKAVLVTKVAASSSNSTTSLKVESLANLPLGSQVKVGSLTNATVSVTARNTDTNVITLSGAVASSTPAAGANVWIVGGVPFEGPFSLIDIQDGQTGNGLFGQGYGSAALSEHIEGAVRDTRHGDQVLDWYDAPMPPTPITVDIRKAGFIKTVWKEDVYWTGTVDSSTQDYPNPYYVTNIPESPYLPAKTAVGDFLWDTWGNDGPQGNGMGNYWFWDAVRIGTNISGNAGETLTTAQQTELGQIRTAYGDDTIARRLVVFSDNHGEAMVIANGDFNLTYDECAANLLGGGKHCDTGDLVGSSDIFATADYPDFRGKHAPVRSNTATIDWTWGGYKTVTIEPGEVEQYVYVVFRALDRDGFCNPPSGAVSLHPVLTSVDAGNTVGAKDPVEAVDFLIDSDEGGIVIQTSAGTSAIDVTREATKEGGLPTYSTTESGRSETATDSTKKFAPLNGAAAECQSWVKLSNSLLGITNVLVFAHDDEGLIGFDKIVDFNDTVEYTLNFRWSLITWMGADNIAPAAALGATGGNAGGTDILDEVTAVYGWEASSQSWLAFFPDGVDIPGANDLTGLRTGNAYWIAIKGPSSITWSVVTDVD